MLMSQPPIGDNKDEMMGYFDDSVEWMGDRPLKDNRYEEVEYLGEYWMAGLENLTKRRKTDMFWVTLRKQIALNSLPAYFLAYGNQAELGWIYGNICMVLDVVQK